MIGPATNPGQQMLNLWTPTPAPATLHRLTPMIGYDINTKLPFHVLETDHIRMEPLVVSQQILKQQYTVATAEPSHRYTSKGS
jgi:hypothetical protein